MITTIQVSPYILVQGLLARRLPGGAIVVQCNGREYVGAPVNAAPASTSTRLTLVSAG